MQAHTLLDAMRQWGVMPNVITYSALIIACEKDKKPKQALELFDMMQQQGVVAGVSSYSSLMQVLAATG